MTVSLKHTFQSAKTDGPDVTIIQPSNWNEEHELELATDKLLGRSTAGTGPAEEIGVGTALSVSGGTLAVTNVPVANGGTGASTLTGYVKGNGTSPFTDSATVPVGDLSGTLPVANGGTGATTLTANNVLLGNGTSAVQTVAPGTAGNALLSDGTSWVSGAVVSSPSLDAIATGSLADGSTVIINADGTVSAVAGQNEIVGAQAIFDTGSPTEVKGVYDANAQKIVLAYRDGAASQAVVGTVSGTSITFGTPVTYAANTDAGAVSIAYDANAQKVVITYRDNANLDYGTAIVGTVSGTSISFGTPTVFESAAIVSPSCAYDANTQKIVIAYNDTGNGQFGTAIVGTVSGTSISFGTAVVFSSAITAFTDIVYDASAQKVVIAYRNNGNSNFGTAIVGTVSGTSISFGTPVVFNSATTTQIASVYDPNAQKVVFVYIQADSLIVGTVSGTNISFGSPTAIGVAATTYSICYDSNISKIVVSYILSNAAPIPDVLEYFTATVSGTSISINFSTILPEPEVAYVALVYDPVAQKDVILYRETGGGDVGVVIQPLATNLTTENFIGFSDAAYTNGQTATIQIIGGVDDAQSSLTAGQSHFVEPNGSLGLAQLNPPVFAGTAVAATKIIVKG